MMQKIQRFGGAMITPVLLFAFNGIMLALSIAFQNENLFGSLAEEGTFWHNIWGVIEQGGWVVFSQLEILFVIGLPIGLAKKASARATLAAFTVYMMWNTFINAIMSTWDFGLNINDVEAIGVKTIGGIATLDTNLIGAILISAGVVWLHNRFYDTELPQWLGIFSGTSFVVILGFFAALPLAYITAIIWPPLQGVIASLQQVMAGSGTIGVGLYVFLEKILIPTGLHHFIYQPFEFGPAVVEGGLQNYWFQHLDQIATYAGSLRDIFPEGGFFFQNAAKPFYPIGIGAAFVATARKEKRKQVLALIVPTALTAMLTGITEPFEFTFLFLAPQLFVVHALLTSTFAMTVYSFGVAGHIGGGLIAHVTGFLLPLLNNHLDAILIYHGVGLAFIAIYFVIFRWAIVKFDLKTPGREDDKEVQLFSKKDYREKQAGKSGSGNSSNATEQKAAGFLEALGGANNIADINNCTTRLRISVNNQEAVADDDAFKAYGAHGVVRNGQAIQVIVGLDVPKVRDAFEVLVDRQA